MKMLTHSISGHGIARAGRVGKWIHEHIWDKWLALFSLLPSVALRWLGNIAIRPLIFLHSVRTPYLDNTAFFKPRFPWHPSRFLISRSNCIQFRSAGRESFLLRLNCRRFSFPKMRPHPFPRFYYSEFRVRRKRSNKSGSVLISKLMSWD